MRDIRSNERLFKSRFNSDQWPFLQFRSLYVLTLFVQIASPERTSIFLLPFLVLWWAENLWLLSIQGQDIWSKVFFILWYHLLVVYSCITGFEVKDGCLWVVGYSMVCELWMVGFSRGIKCEDAKPVPRTIWAQPQAWWLRCFDLLCDSKGCRVYIVDHLSHHLEMLALVKLVKRDVQPPHH